MSSESLSIVFESVYLKKANSSSVDRVVLNDTLANKLVKRLNSIFNNSRSNNNNQYPIKKQLKNIYPRIQENEKISIDLSIERDSSTSGAVTIKIPYIRPRNNNNSNTTSESKKKLYLFIRDLRDNMFIRVDNDKYFIYLS
jgi:hypothetical protein